MEEPYTTPTTWHLLIMLITHTAMGWQVVLQSAFVVSASPKWLCWSLRHKRHAQVDFNGAPFKRAINRLSTSKTFIGKEYCYNKEIIKQTFLYIFWVFINIYYINVTFFFVLFGSLVHHDRVKLLLVRLVRSLGYSTFFNIFFNVEAM